MSRVDLLRFASPDELAESAATRWLGALRSAAGSGRVFSVAMPGGRIARQFLVAVAKRSRESELTLDHVDFFWSDERGVPPDDPASNFLLAQRELLSPLGIPAERIHRIRGELRSTVAAKEAAADLMRRVAADARGVPVLDLVLLGMGEDGHVASLFPGEPDAVADSPDLFRVVIAPKPPPRRITMGYGPLAAAREVWVLASGLGKEEALRASLSDHGRTPLARVIESRPLTRVFTDIGGV